MAVRTDKDVSVEIDEELGRLSPAFRDCCIFKVHHKLRKINEQAYQPTIISIGPYHHGNDKLRFMEAHKLRYLQLFLHRRNETSSRYVISMRNLVKQARECYAEPPTDFLDDDKFVKTMLLDGCFIIELFRRAADEERNGRTEPIFKMPWAKGALMIDLLLFENQLPFFVLEELYDMNSYRNDESLISLALQYFDGFCGTPDVERVNPGSIGEVTHLLGLVYCSRLPIIATMRQEKQIRSNQKNRIQMIHCATKLREAGISFQEHPEGCMFDLNFSNGVLKIPPLEVNDYTDSFFRNLIAYEQYGGYKHHYYFTDYVIFFDCLINSPKDVEWLVKGKTISNDLGDEQAVANMFNKLSENVIYDPDKFCYSHIFTTINKHCEKPCNEHLAKLRHNYFNSPWSLASFLAAVSLLLLTITQTLFSVLSYVKE